MLRYSLVTDGAPVVPLEPEPIGRARCVFGARGLQHQQRYEDPGDEADDGVEPLPHPSEPSGLSFPPIRSLIAAQVDFCSHAIPHRSADSMPAPLGSPFTR